MLTEITPAPVTALPLAELATHLRLPSGFINDAAQADGLELYLRAACSAVEGMTGRALFARRFLWKVTRWRQPERQTIPIAPVNFIASVTLIGASGAWESVDSARYVLLRDTFTPCLAGPGGRTLPAIPTDGVAEVELEAGYGADWMSIPVDLRQAAMLLASHFHEQRHITMNRADEAPFGVRNLVSRFRQVRL